MARAFLCLCLAAASAYTPPLLSSLSPQPRGLPSPPLPSSNLAATRHSSPPSLLPVVARARPPTSSLASPGPSDPSSSRLSSLRRLRKLAVSTILPLLLTSTSFAADRLKSAPAASPFVLTADMIKWGGLAAVFGAAYFFRTEETPILTETVMEPTEEAGNDDAPSAELDVMSDLKKRMQQLADEKDKEPSDSPDDSSDEWGMGSTAVLEPPDSDSPKSPGLFDDEPAVDFPLGYPLRDGEDNGEPLDQPLASQDQVEMLQRMFQANYDGKA